MVYDNKVFLAVGQDPENGAGPGHLYAIDATKQGDITQTGAIWHFGDKDFGLVALDGGGGGWAALHGRPERLPLLPGRSHRETTVAPRHVRGRLGITPGGGRQGLPRYHGREVLVVEHGSKLKELALNDVLGTVYSTPAAAHGVLYIATRRAVFALQQAQK